MSSSRVSETLRGLYRPIQAELDRVEGHLRELSRHANPLIAEIHDYLFEVAGKRLRPALLLFCNRLYGQPEGEASFWAATIEVIHTASLIHDDIVDNSDRRRGRASVHARWGPNVTVLLGDFLYIQSIVRTLATRRDRLTNIMAGVTAEMIEGELIEVSWAGRFQVPESIHLDILDRKTSSLFGGACRIGAVLGHAPAEEEDRIESFGRKLGLSFQIIDDWLDFTGNPEILGKPVLSDIREGRATLPLILALQRMDNRGRRELLTLIESGINDPESASRVLDFVRPTGALDEAMERARAYAREATSILEGFPPSEARQALLSLTRLLLERTA